MPRIHAVGERHDQKYLFDVLMPSEPRLRGRSALQVGARGAGALEMTARLKKAGYSDLDVLEVWRPNAEWCGANLRVRRVVQGDVRLISSLAGLEPRYDLIVWWHGPEHVSAADLAELVPSLSSKCGALVVGCPWGVWEQGDLRGNPHERHEHHLYPEDLLALGFDDVYTFESGQGGPGPDKHNVMMAAKYSESR